MGYEGRDRFGPSKPRRRWQSRSPRGRYESCGEYRPTRLLVKNLRHDCRPEDLRGPFGQYGKLKDISLPKDKYTGEHRGFGYVQYVDPADAAKAKDEMNGCDLLGQELTVDFAEESMMPEEMGARDSKRRPCPRDPSERSRSPRRRRS